MSILLEALRKSEKSQRPVVPANIHMDEPGEMAPQPMRAGLVALLLIAALLIIAWLVWRQYQPVTKGYQPPVTLQATKASTEAVAGAAPVSTAVTKPAVAKTVGVADKPAADKPADKPADQADDKVARRSRTPVESFAPAVVKDEPAPVQPTSAKNTKGKPRGAQKGNKKAGAGSKAKKAKAVEKFQPQDPEPITYWELPDAVREDFPEIKFSVLVYSEAPADRFVLVNGQRLSEGDSYQEGLVVKEIRRDGVIFSYRLYQFLVRR